MQRTSLATAGARKQPTEMPASWREVIVFSHRLLNIALVSICAKYASYFHSLISQNMWSFLLKRTQVRTMRWVDQTNRKYVAACALFRTFFVNSKCTGLLLSKTTTQRKYIVFKCFVLTVRTLEMTQLRTTTCTLMINNLISTCDFRFSQKAMI